MKTKNIKTVKAQVEYILMHHPESRSNDSKLQWLVWETFYRDSLGYDEDIGWYVTPDLESVGSLPDSATIRRVRRKLQQKGLYLVETAKKNAELKRKKGGRVSPHQKAMIDNINVGMLRTGNQQNISKARVIFHELSGLVTDYRQQNMSGYCSDDISEAYYD